MKEYKDYLDEIEDHRKRYNLQATQVLTLQLAAAFECGQFTYNRLLGEFCKEDGE